VQDVRTVKRDYDNLVALLTGKVTKTWGKKEVKLPSRVQYKVHAELHEPRRSGFRRRLVTVETLDDKDPRTSLKNAIVTTLLTPNDRAPWIFIPTAASRLRARPYLLGLVVDQNKNPWARRPMPRASPIICFRRRPRRARSNSTAPRRIVVREDSDGGEFREQAGREIQSFVEQFATQYQIEPGVRHHPNGKYSNPFAVSSATAYGLMQLVPGSGGREAYRRAKRSEEIPSKQ
jgi:membrane-bound lytic murein transglycosylase C